MIVFSLNLLVVLDRYWAVAKGYTMVVSPAVSTAICSSLGHYIGVCGSLRNGAPRFFYLTVFLGCPKCWHFVHLIN